ncbi:MAG TPA: hypothetical protein VN241_10670 [Microbacterium sp.]|nr:hypothetical protein [Microbacterium sp.]
MRSSRCAVSVIALIVVAVPLAGCSADTLIWGAEGARVISTTEQLVELAGDGEGDRLACSDAVADFGASADWAGLSAGEPERFHAEYWPEQEPLEPVWNINLELGSDSAEPGLVFPGDVFYRETDAGLCVIDVVWSTVLG